MPGQNCFYCNHVASLLCDGKVLTKSGRLSCDRPLCKNHRHLIRTGIACARGGRGKNRSRYFTIDYCPDCNLKGRQRIEIAGGA